MRRAALLLPLFALACTNPPADDGGLTFDPTDEGTGDGDQPGECGDGHVDPGEVCDLGPDNSDNGPCTSMCTIAECGDGLVYEGFEECDDGNGANTDD